MKCFLKDVTRLRLSDIDFCFLHSDLFISREKLNHPMEMKSRVLMKSYMFKYQPRHMRKLMQQFL
jgi:hypothetical protein